jgi:hypothetical protein
MVYSLQCICVSQSAQNELIIGEEGVISCLSCVRLHKCVTSETADEILTISYVNDVR